MRKFAFELAKQTKKKLFLVSFWPNSFLVRDSLFVLNINFLLASTLRSADIMQSILLVSTAVINHDDYRLHLKF